MTLILSNEYLENGELIEDKNELKFENVTGIQIDNRSGLIVITTTTKRGFNAPVIDSREFKKIIVKEN